MSSNPRLLIALATALMFFTRSASAFGMLRQRTTSLRMSLLDDFTSKSSVDGLLGSALGRAINTLNTKREFETATIVSDPVKESNPQPSGYATNPCVHFTSLSHLQWEYVLRPGVDSAIDATCGNGHDSCEIAKRLFPDDAKDPGDSELICIDIQKMACEATQQALEDRLDPNIVDTRVKVLHASHDPLPVTSSPLALVCWNLGYLPNSDNKATYTKTESTVTSIADAALQLRVGGLLSVMTYPKTNANEDFAVHALFEGLALLTSKSTDWNDYLDSLGEDPIPAPDNPFSVKTAVTTALQRIVAQGDTKQTWRAMEHKMMGRSLSPMLLTVTRIK